MSTWGDKRLIIERQHWWFSGRRRVLNHLAKHFLRQHESARLRICEIDCGTGVDLEAWESAHDVLGIESEADMITVAKKLLHGRVAVGALPNALSVERQAWDLVLLPDTLACVEECHRSAMIALQLLRPGGILIATVPSRFGYWFCHQRRCDSPSPSRGTNRDEVPTDIGAARNGTSRSSEAAQARPATATPATATPATTTPATERQVAGQSKGLPLSQRTIRRGFSRAEFLELFSSEEYRIELLSYFNCLPCRSRGGQVGRWGRRESKGPYPTLGLTGPMNHCLREIMASERWILPLAPLPFGSSLIVVVRRLTEAEFVSERKYPMMAFEAPMAAKQVARVAQRPRF